MKPIKFLACYKLALIVFPRLRIYASTILVIVVFFGLQSRFFTDCVCAEKYSVYQADHSDHHHGENLPYDVTQVENCSQDPHHNDCSCQGFSLANARHQAHILSAPCMSLLGVRHEREIVPDGPFISGEKPPLI